MREVEQVVSPTAGLNINPGGSTGKFQMDTGEECIREETKRVLDDKKESTKSCQEKLQDFT